MDNLKIYAETCEIEAREQIRTLMKLKPFQDSKVRIMPDVHAGKGCVIGFTSDYQKSIIPNIIGVDIGCGILCVKLKNSNIDLNLLDKTIRNYIPSGFNIHPIPLSTPFTLGMISMIEEMHCFEHLTNKEKFSRSIGTLGGGNHFIEVDVDENGDKYLVIHTGSRNLGKQVADYYQNKAFEYCKENLQQKYQMEVKKIVDEHKKQGTEQDIQQKLIDLKAEYGCPPKDLCWLSPKDTEDYLDDMRVCQCYAQVNRETIAKIIIDALKLDVEYWFESVHNYISFNDNIIRKGAISAHDGEQVIIPMNMRDGSIIGKGKGNIEWNCSAPHGAGRVMSRSQARKNIEISDFYESMKGIYTTSVCEGTLDEAPMCYKPMEEITNLISDTVNIQRIIKPIYNFKAE